MSCPQVRHMENDSVKKIWECTGILWDHSVSQRCLLLWRESMTNSYANAGTINLVIVQL